MSRKLTASDRKALIKMASTLPVGSGERRAILAGLNKTTALREGSNVRDLSRKAAAALRALNKAISRLRAAEAEFQFI